MSCSDLNSDLSDRSCDTLISVSKPAKTRKEWLISNVRILSRVYVKKGEGQDGVCKPDWWDREVGLQWRNHTGKSKDTVEDLKKKYEALARKLREEKRFPAELDDEARLWDVGKVNELFQLVSEKMLYKNLKKIVCVCTRHVDKYGLDQINPDVFSNILIQITNLQKCFKVHSNINQLTSGIDKEADRDKLIKKSFSIKNTKTSASKNKRHTSLNLNHSLYLQTKFNSSSTQQANNIIQKSFKSNQSAEISEKSKSTGCENVCQSTNYNKTDVRSVESTINRKGGIEYPDIGSSSHEKLVENNFAENKKEEKLLKRKSPCDSVINITHCKHRCESTPNVDVGLSSKSCQISLINLTKKNKRIEELKNGNKEKREILHSNATEDDLSTPTHLSIDESRNEPLFEKIISETFKGEEQDILFSGNSQDMADLYFRIASRGPITSSETF